MDSIDSTSLDRTAADSDQRSRQFLSISRTTDERPVRARILKYFERFVRGALTLLAVASIFIWMYGLMLFIDWKIRPELDSDSDAKELLGIAFLVLVSVASIIFFVLDIMLFLFLFDLTVRYFQSDCRKTSE